MTDTSAILEAHTKWRLGKPGGVRADLSDADLRYANLRHADLTRVIMSGADLRDAIMSGANLSGADLSDADLRGADLRGVIMSGADLRDADLSYADLRYANLRHADLTRANLDGADLRDADLTRANLDGADLRDADLECARLPVGYAAWQGGAYGPRRRMLRAIRRPDGAITFSAGCISGDPDSVIDQIATERHPQWVTEIGQEAADKALAQVRQLAAIAIEALS